MEELEPKERYVRFENKKLFYVEVGAGFPVIILLGWASDLKKFPYQEVLTPNWEFVEKYRLFFLHLSNFSKSDISEIPYNLENYANELKEVLNKFGFEKVNLIGHSAGGRIATYFTIKFGRKVNKLVLMNSAGLKHKNIYKITAPTLIIVGKLDKTLNISNAHAFNRRIINSQLIIYPSLGYSTLYEPSVFLKIFNFLDNP